MPPTGPAKINPFNGLVTPAGGFNESSLKILDPATNKWVTSFTDSSGTYSVVDGRVIVTPANGSGDVHIQSLVFKVADNSGSEQTGTQTVVIAALDNLPEDLGPLIANESTDSLSFKADEAIAVEPSDVFKSLAGEKFDSSTFGFRTPSGVVKKLKTSQGVWTIVDGRAVFSPVRGFKGYVRTDVAIRDSNGVLRTTSISLSVKAAKAAILPKTGSNGSGLARFGLMFILLGGIFVELKRRLRSTRA